MSSSDAILGFAPPADMGSSGFQASANSPNQLSFAGTQTQTHAYAGDAATQGQPASDGSPGNAATGKAAPQPAQATATPGVSNAYAPTKPRGSLLSRLLSRETPRASGPANDQAENAASTGSQSASPSVSAPSASDENLPGLGLDNLFEINSSLGSRPVSGSEIKLASAAGLGHLSRQGLRIQHDRVKTTCFKPDLIKLVSKV